MCLMSCKTTIESEVPLEAVSLFIRGRGKAVYILPSSYLTFVLLLIGFTEYDDDDDIFPKCLYLYMCYVPYSYLYRFYVFGICIGVWFY
ncbi:hypothetical protein Hanom_Chr13g01244311 [Helianthus anomalus]